MLGRLFDTEKLAALKIDADSRFERMSRQGACGKAVIVYLVSGSAGLALIAYLIFAGVGC